MRIRLITRLLLICLLASILTACLPGDTQMLAGVFDEWARAKGLNPKNEKGQIDPVDALIAGYNVGRRAVTGSTGDPDADAALGVVEVIYPITQLDQQTDQAIDQGDPSKIEAAIKDRPDDYHYQNALAVLQLSKGDQSTANSSYRAADQAWLRANPKSPMDRGDQAIARDNLSLLDRAIKGEATNGTTQEGKTLLRKRYCQDAQFLTGAAKTSYYVDRAKSVLKIDCSSY
jgi:hypothetical protein